MEIKRDYYMDKLIGKKDNGFTINLFDFLLDKDSLDL